MNGTIATSVLLGVLSILVLILTSALVEVYHQVQQIRSHLDLVDRVTPLDLGTSKGLAPSSVGLPNHLDSTSRAMVLFLSNKCGTCRTIAATLSGGAIPPTLTVVVEGPVDGDEPSLVTEFDLGHSRVIVDSHHHISDQLGIDVAPAAISIESGRIVSGQTIPSTRQFLAALPLVEDTVIR